jgi:hypothetical protein
LQRQELFDPGVEAARNACAAGASLASAAITAAAYYDNPLTGSGALVACLRRLGELSGDDLPGGSTAALARFIEAFERIRVDEQPQPGFGHVTRAQALAVSELARELAAACDCPSGARRLLFFLEHAEPLFEALGALNPAGLAALVFHDHGVAEDEAEALYLMCRIEAAVREARAARAAGLSRFPFSAYRYVYEGARPPPRQFNWSLLIERCGLADECGGDDTAPPGSDERTLAPPTAPAHTTFELRAGAGVVDIGQC